MKIIEKTGDMLRKVTRRRQDKPIQTPDRADVGIAPYSEERRIFQHRGGACVPRRRYGQGDFLTNPTEKIAPADPAKTVRSAGAECICV